METSAYGPRKGPNSEIGLECCRRFKARAARAPYSPDIYPPDFFLFGWLKGKPEWQQFIDPDQLSELVDDIFTSLSVDIIQDVFRNRIHQRNRSFH
jgi:hypothetical protein